MKRACTRCGEIKDITEFSPSKRGKDGRRSHCHTCCCISSKEWRSKNADKVRKTIALYRKNNPEKIKEWAKRNPEKIKAKSRKQDLKRNHNITQKEYEMLLNSQDGKCAICHTDRPNCRNVEHLSVDHDHETGRIRGLLCQNCNLGIGHLKDNTTILESALFYLKERSSIVNAQVEVM